jgi:4-hydroxy-2-oxoheptanedioate aldolase
MFALHSFPEVPGPQYDANADKETVVFVQIESRPGVENVEKIVAVEGLDGVLIGELARKEMRCAGLG